jgi:hypothetical protein
MTNMINITTLLRRMAQAERVIAGLERRLAALERPQLSEYEDGLCSFSSNPPLPLLLCCQHCGAEYPETHNHKCKLPSKPNGAAELPSKPS